MKQAVFLVPLLGAILPAASAFADVQYTETMKMGGDASAFGMTTKTWLKEGLRRSETSMAMTGMDMGTVTIERCEEGKTYTLAPDLKLYAISTPGAAPGLGIRGLTSNREKPAKTGTGTSTLEYSLQDLGIEKVAGVDTRHYSLSMKVTNTGCAGEETHTAKFETWVSDIKLPLCTMKTSPAVGAPALPASRPACDVKTEIKGDVAALGKAFRGLTMRMKMDMNGQPMTKEITAFSQAPLDDTLFQIPADFKQVSQQELGQAQGRAMMKKIMGGGGGGMPDMGNLANMGAMGGSMSGMSGNPLGGFLGEGLKGALQGASGGGLPF